MSNEPGAQATHASRDARADRERAAYDEGGVDATMVRWHGRFSHVFQSPNSLRHERIFDEEAARAVTGRRVVDIGCGPGESSARLLDMGAEYVLGIDISEREIANARRRAVAGKLEFLVGDVTQMLDGTFDVAFGRSILHHIDYRAFLPRIYEQHLSPGGTMLFMEPLGSNLLVRAYDRLVPAAHTSDEQSLRSDDLEWIEAHFADVTIRPVNYVTFPAAIATSMLSPRNADNVLLRWCDRADVALARRPKLRHRFRQASFVIRKAA